MRLQKNAVIFCHYIYLVVKYLLLSWFPVAVEQGRTSVILSSLKIAMRVSGHKFSPVISISFANLQLSGQADDSKSAWLLQSISEFSVSCSTTKSPGSSLASFTLNLLFVWPRFPLYASEPTANSVCQQLISQVFNLQAHFTPAAPVFFTDYQVSLSSALLFCIWVWMFADLIWYLSCLHVHTGVHSGWSWEKLYKWYQEGLQFCSSVQLSKLQMHISEKNSSHSKKKNWSCNSAKNKNKCLIRLINLPVMTCKAVGWDLE